MTMRTTSDAHALWQRLESFTVGRGDEALTFVARLARENGWSRPHAERVFAEYRRFVFLAMHAGHPVTPSEAVDQAWHLHLTYTRSYWHDLCRDTLGRDLHHGPTEGGPAEGAKFFDWYAKTLASYRRLLGEEPDPRIWPAAKARFAHAGDGRWVRRSEVVTIPRRRAWLGAVATAVLLLTTWSAWWSPTSDGIRTADGTAVLIILGAIAIVGVLALLPSSNRRRRRRSRDDSSATAGDAAAGGTGWWMFGGCGSQSGDADGSSGGGDSGCGGGGCGGCGGCGG